MNRFLACWAGICLFAVLFPVVLPGQTSCEDGNSSLNTAQPKAMTVPDIIQKFAAKEAIFRQARNNYDYTQDVTVQTLDGKTVDGEYRQVWDISYDDKGGRVEAVTFAPQDTLSRVSLTPEDLEDFRNRLPFVLTTDDLPLYNILYVGEQHVDEIDTYVFDVAPKAIEKGKRYFQGRIWVDDHDLQIVKTCGQNVPDVRATSKKKNARENLTPKFVTYREQVDGQYWFPTYTRADDFLHFQGGDVHIREIIKYTNYKRFGSRTKIIFKGEVPPEKDQKPPEKKPQ
ncbi:MAG TPA: hypothetical protein VN176_17305 [Verrucomicrobiae bacterium]|jgi:hypothetical protein|nr:hypothetical protein [Verrucomicrobiae bacterium]